MKSDFIKEIKIDKLGRLCIFPTKEQFSLVWRTATEVQWDEREKFLFSPKPREWTYFEWFNQILKTAKDCGCKLLITNETVWINVPDLIKQQIDKQENF